MKTVSGRGHNGQKKEKTEFAVCAPMSAQEKLTKVE